MVLARTADGDRATAGDRSALAGVVATLFDGAVPTKNSRAPTILLIGDHHDSTARARSSGTANAQLWPTRLISQEHMISSWYSALGIAAVVLAALTRRGTQHLCFFALTPIFDNLFWHVLLGETVRGDVTRTGRDCGASSYQVLVQHSLNKFRHRRSH